MKKKILFFSHRAKHGGGERSFFELILELHHTQKIDGFIVLGEKGWLYDKFSDCGWTPLILNFPSIKSFSFPSAFKILKIIKTQKIEIIHCNTTRAMLYAAFVKIFVNIRIIWHQRGTDKRGLFEYILALFADNIIAISNTVRQQLLDLKINPKKIICVYNGIRIDNSEIIEKQIPKNSDSKFYIALVGRFTIEKGHRYLIEIANILINRRKKENLKFVFCGAAEFGESQYSEIIELIKNYQLTDYFEFVGYIENIPKFLNEKIDITAITSQREAFGRVILESWLAKTPIIAFAVEGPAEIIDNNKTGILIEKNNIEKFADAIENLLNDNKLYQYLTACGAQKLQEFDLKNTAAKILEIYLNEK